MLITDKDQLVKYSSEYRLWQGIPSIERTKGGRLFCTFYSGGTKEEPGNYCVLIKSDDDGIAWTEPIACSFIGDEDRCYDPGLWIDPLGRLWFAWATFVKGELGAWAAICENPDAEELVWSDPVKIGKGVMLNKPTVLSTGEWLFPVGLWNKDYIKADPGEQKLSYVYSTTDNGKTFARLGGADVPNRNYDEHMVLELRDGRLLMYVRTFYGIGKSYSYDRGHTWTPGEPAVDGTDARFFLRRLSSGNILLIRHHNDTRSRNNLTAMISTDEGETWQGFLMIDERSQVSYPDAVEAEDGYIYITYDRERGSFKQNLEEALSSAREILMAKVTERDILEGRVVDENSRLKQIINKLGEYKGPSLF